MRQITRMNESRHIYACRQCSKLVLTDHNAQVVERLTANLNLNRDTLCHSATVELLVCVCVCVRTFLLVCSHGCVHVGV